MSKIKKIYIEGKTTITFEDDDGQEVCVSEESEKKDEAQSIVSDFISIILDPEDKTITSDFREKLQEMTLREIMELCLNTSKNLVAEEEDEDKAMPSWCAEKMSVISNPSRYSCLHCSSGTLTVRDGHLMCVVCGHDYGDIDDLPEFI